MLIVFFKQPKNHLELHRRLLERRNTVLAHDDLTEKDARTVVFETDDGKSVSIIENVILGTEEFSRIDEIIDLIEKVLLNLYKEIEELGEELPVSS